MHPDDRELYILSLERQVVYTAKILLRRFRNGGYDYLEDFVQAGWVGAIRAVDNWDPTRGTLQAYAKFRIRGYILDYMRTCDHLTRNHRSDVKDSECAPVNIPIDGQLDGDGHRFDIEDQRAIQAYGTINTKLTTLTILRRAELPARLQKILLEYYWDLKPMKKIGKRMKIGEGRVSQLHHNAINKLRAAGA